MPMRAHSSCHPNLVVFLLKKGDRHIYSSCGDNRDNLTVLIAGNAAGNLANPMIIFSYDRIYSSVAVCVPDE